jgi:hypothetical protein
VRRRLKPGAEKETVSEIVYKGFKIKLVALNPYPKVSEPIDPKDYEATLVVTRDE